MMPLPRFNTADAPTSTWGGTMIGVSRACKHPDDAWKLIEFLNFSDAGLENLRQEHQQPAAPVRLLEQTRLPRARPLFRRTEDLRVVHRSGRPGPPPAMRLFSTLGRFGLGYALNQAASYLKSAHAHGLGSSVAAQLKRGQTYVRRCIEHGTFE